MVDKEFDIGDPGLGGEQIGRVIMVKLLIDYANEIKSLDPVTNTYIWKELYRAFKAINDRYVDLTSRGLETFDMKVPEADSIITRLFLKYFMTIKLF